MSKWPLFILCILTNVARASIDDAHQQGKNFAESQKNNAIQNTQTKIDKDVVPGFEGGNPKQTGLDKNGNFQDAINGELKSSEAAQSLLESFDKRTRYKLDPNTDPLFSSPDNKTIESTLDIQEVGTKIEKDVPKTLTCEEGGEDVTYECFQDRSVVPQVPLKRLTLNINYAELVRNAGCFKDGIGHLPLSTRDYNIDPTTFRNNVCPTFQAVDASTGTRYNMDCIRVQRYWLRSVVNMNRETVHDRYGKSCNPVSRISIEFEHDTYEGEGTDQWISYCDSLEEMVNQGLCRYGDKVCTQGPETRTINGYKVYKDCWQYRQRYHCKMIKDECSALRTQGCHQVSSKCKEQKQGKCWIFEQTYECPSDRIQRPPTHVSSLFCLTGNCQDASYQSNGEMLDVVSKLAMLKEVQNDTRAQQSLGSFEIFKGSNQQCNRNCVDFKDCCGGMNGWGVSLHLSNCTEQEKLLANMREKGLCRFVGTYCAEKVLGICIRKKTTFCCFGTKFSRLLQEQGRPQIGLDWGTPENPNCRGFTVEELSKIDFSKVDMRELFADIMQKFRSPNLESVQQKTTEKIQESMKRFDSGQVKDIPKTGALNDKEKSY